MPDQPAAKHTLPSITSNFEVKIHGLDVDVGFFTQVTGLSAQVDVLEYPEGGLNDFVHKLPDARSSRATSRSSAAITKRDDAARPGSRRPSSRPSRRAVDSRCSTARATPVQTLERSTNAYPVKWTGTDLNAGGTEILTESLEIAHHGHRRCSRDGLAATRPRPRASSRPSSSIDGGADARLLLQPDRVLGLEDQRRGSTRRSPARALADAGVRRRPAAPDGAQPAVRPDASRRTR